MKSFLKSFLIVTCTLFSVAVSNAQSSKPVSFYATGGIKTTRFQEIQKRVAAYNPSPGYNESDINPVIKNSSSFFAGTCLSKPLSKRFSVSNMLALDMQQLFLTSGFQKRATIGGRDVYATTDDASLLARLKLDFGIHYNIVANETNTFSLGIRAGQMLALSNKANSYSIVGAELRFEHRNSAVFVSGTLTPYRTKIRGLENYVGNMNAEQITAEYAYRIYELNLGYAIRL